MVQNNAINNQSFQLTVDPAAASDSFIQFDESTTGKWRIGNDATDDSYRLSQGSALGTNDTFVMTSAGERTMPLQPAFMGNIGSNDANVSGDGTIYTVGTNVAFTERFDQNGDFNTNGTFTAPVTGRYTFNCGVLGGDFNAATSYLLILNTSNRNYLNSQNDPTATANSSGFYGQVNAYLTDLDAADEAIMQYATNGAGGVTTDIIGNSSNVTFFSGSLTC